MTFELQEGKEIAFVSIFGKWHGRIRERLWGCSRAQVLPVFCKGHGDVAAALQALRGKPVKYGQQRIHRMRRRESAGGEEFVYLGEGTTSIREEYVLHQERKPWMSLFTLDED